MGLGLKTDQLSKYGFIIVQQHQTQAPQSTNPSLMQINWPEGDRLTWAYVLMGLPQKTEK